MLNVDPSASIQHSTFNIQHSTFRLSEKMAGRGAAVTHRMFQCASLPLPSVSSGNCLRRRGAVTFWIGIAQQEARFPNPNPGHDYEDTQRTTFRARLREESPPARRW